MPDVNLSRLKATLGCYEYGELHDLHLALKAVLKEKRGGRPIHYWRMPLMVESWEACQLSLCGMTAVIDYGLIHGWGVLYRVTRPNVRWEDDYDKVTCKSCLRRDPGKLRRDYFLEETGAVEEWDDDDVELSEIMGELEGHQ